MYPYTLRCCDFCYHEDFTPILAKLGILINIITVGHHFDFGRMLFASLASESQEGAWVGATLKGKNMPSFREQTLSFMRSPPQEKKKRQVPQCQSICPLIEG